MQATVDRCRREAGTPLFSGLALEELTMKATEALRAAFTDLTAEQKDNVRKHLAVGVKVLAGPDGGGRYYSKDGL